MKLGLIVNPIAGIGGRVGLKGSDGEQIQQRAREMGAVPRSGQRALQALKALASMRQEVQLYTCSGEMGAQTAHLAGFDATVITVLPENGITTREHTIETARELRRLGMDLILFSGGDGTARDIYDAVGQDLPALGIPAGVKMQSAVYGITPESTGTLALEFLTQRFTRLGPREVMDLDEEALRKGEVIPRLYGYLMVPDQRRYVQNRKIPALADETAVQAAIAQRIVNEMEPDRTYIIGPGTTTNAILDALSIQGTLIGVDVIRNKQLILKDANETQLLKLLKENCNPAIIVTLIGGQGVLFGRGNQQISPEVIRKTGKEHITIAATPQKIHTLDSQPIRVDTGDRETDRLLAGYQPVVTGFNDRIVYRVEV